MTRERSGLTVDQTRNDVCDRTHDLHESFLSEGCDILWEVSRFTLMPVGHDVPTQDPQFPTAGRLKLYGKGAHRVQVPKTDTYSTRRLSKQCPWCRHE